MLSVGTSHPPDRYTQQDILEMFRVVNPVVRALFAASHIQSRYLVLPQADASGRPAETQGQLLKKHRRWALRLGRQAIDRCLENTGIKPTDIDALCCVTSTGFMLPGLTAMFIKHLGLRTDCHRVDIVGMGCNAGLNALNPVTAWAQCHPGKNALMVCCEINSALYLYDDTVNTGVVNSLFGDGCAAVLLRADPADEPTFAPRVLGFQSHLIPDAWDAMIYRWSDTHGRFGFNLARDVPYVLGAHADIPVHALLDRHKLKVRDVSHWLVHSGGKKVIDAIKYTVGLTAHDVRHTVDVLRTMGNLGSGSFLFSYQRLVAERVVRRGDYAILMTMGPGSTVETALVRW
ncbi:MAG: type III polyketide synthase [Oligoflexia bacterium]|nr:type III polyketide synthase [Oligoflexia bacterium]